MSVIAVAGGTDGIGRAVTEAIVAQGLFKVIVLTRKASDSGETQSGAQEVQVDYSNTDSLVDVFESNHVHTVISALSGLAPPETEISLIRASDRASTTKRFIPNVWTIKYPSEYSWFIAAGSKIAALDALEETQLEWTAVCNGFFLDYWGMPKVHSYLKRTVIVLDIEHRRAAIPGSGDTPVVFTYTGDVGKYTAALLTLGKWDKESFVIGTKISWNNFTKLAEDVLGEKFKVTHDSVELLNSGKITELPAHRDAYTVYPKDMLQSMFATFGLIFHSGLVNLPDDKAINHLFPDIKPLSAKDILEMGWKN